MTVTDQTRILTPMFDNIPQGLKDYPYWCCWNSRKMTDKNGEPYYSKEPAKSDGSLGLIWSEKDNLVDFKTVVQLYNTGKFKGVGVVLFEDTPLVCIDLDDFENINDIPAEKHNLTITAYTEVSPSGNGLHLWYKGIKPEWVGTKKNGVEFYGGQQKFLTVTGHRYDGNAAPDVPEGQRIIDEAAQKYFGTNKRQKKSSNQTNDRNSLVQLNDDEVIFKLSQRKTAWNLFNGDTSNFREHDESKFDFALAKDIAKISNDADQIERIMRRSKLYRDKWDTHKSYLPKYTIANAMIEVSLEEETNQSNYSIDDTSGQIQEKSEPKQNHKPWWKQNDNGTMSLLHEVLAKEIMTKYNIVRHPHAHSDLYFYNHKKGIYEQDTTGRQVRAIIRYTDDLKRNHIREVLEYIYDMSPIVEKVSQQYIAVENGLINSKTFALEEFKPGAFVTKKIGTKYNAVAKCDFVDNTLQKISCGHRPTIENIKEMFACVLYPKLLVPKMFYLYGRTAHNGKSSILNMIHETFDSEGGNISAISPQKLADNTFAGASIYGKLANIVDDLPDKPIEDSGLLKTIITGGRIEIERKGKDSETVKIETTMIAASNYFPNFKENGKQINRRLHILPCEHDFSKDPDVISDIEAMQIITSDAAKEYVLKLAVDTLRKMLSLSTPDKLTPNEKAEEIAEVFAEQSDPLSDYFFEYDADYFHSNAGTSVLADYEDWCQLNRVHPFGAKRFKEAVCLKYNMEWTSKRVILNGKSKVVKGFKQKAVTNSLK